MCLCRGRSESNGNILISLRTYDAPLPSGRMTYKFEPKTVQVGSEHTYVSPSIFRCIARDGLLGVIPVSQHRGYEKDEDEGGDLEVHDHEHGYVNPRCSVTKQLKCVFPTVKITEVQKYN